MIETGRALVSLLPLLIAFGCRPIPAEAKCAARYIFVHGMVELLASDVALKFDIDPDPGFAEESHRVITRDFSVRLLFDPTRSGGRFHHSCSRAPEQVTVHLVVDDERVRSVALSIEKDFLRDDDGDYRLAHPLTLGRSDDRSTGAVPTDCAGSSDKWTRVLAAGEERLRASGRKGLRELSLVDASPAAALRTVLLAEIEDDADLSQPRPVWTPEPDLSAVPEGIEIRPLVMVRGEVTECGHFREPSLQASSGDETLDQEILRVAGEALFRPAWRDERWQSGSATLTIHIQLE